MIIDHKNKRFSLVRGEIFNTPWGKVVAMPRKSLGEQAASFLRMPVQDGWLCGWCPFAKQVGYCMLFECKEVVMILRTDNVSQDINTARLIANGLYSLRLEVKGMSFMATVRVGG